MEPWEIQTTLYSKKLLNIDHMQKVYWWIEESSLSYPSPLCSSKYQKTKCDEQTKDIMPSQEGIIHETQWRKDIYLCISHNFWLSQGVDESISTYARAVLIAALTHGGCLLSTAVLQHRTQSWKCSILSGPDAPIPSPQQTSSLQFGKAVGKRGSRGLLHCLWSWSSTAEWMHHYRPARTDNA